MATYQIDLSLLKESEEIYEQSITELYSQGQACKKSCYDFIFSLGGNGSIKSKESFKGVLLCDQERIVKQKEVSMMAMSQGHSIRCKADKAKEILDQLQVVSFDYGEYAERVKAGCDEVDRLKNYSDELTKYAKQVKAMDESMQKRV